MIKLNINNFGEKIDEVDTQALENVKKKLNAGEYGFINILGAEEYVRMCEEVIEIISSWADTLVIIGIGGSDLGGRAIQQALDNYEGELDVFFAGDTTDPNEISVMMSELNLETTVFNIVSKSGTTVEIMAHYLFFKDRVKSSLGGDWTKHFVFTTDREEGVLRDEANKYQITTLPIESNVGGRFSVLTPVGLLPAAAIDLNLNSLTKGGKRAVQDFLDNNENSIAWNIAAYQFAHYQLDRYVSVIMPYSVRLNEFARWYRQLWAESLGKEGKGIMPVQAHGPADQHSQLQFYTQGRDLATFTFLKVKDHQEHHIIRNTEISELAYLDGAEFADILNIEADATQLSLTNQGRPNLTLEIAKVDAEHLGELFVTFEIAVTLLGELLEVNTFNQPGVEESKQEMYRRLGRPGF